MRFEAPVSGHPASPHSAGRAAPPLHADSFSAAFFRPGRRGDGNQQARDAAIARRGRCSVSEVDRTRRSTMSGRRRATLFEDLPEEIVVDQILIRLPSKDVGRCRTVCTLWRSATSTPQFMLQHHCRQPLLPIVDGHGQPASYVVFQDAAAGTSSQDLWPFRRGSEGRLENGIFASCDGFLITRHGHRLYICNPVIRRHALLPVAFLPIFGQDFVNIVIGFYRHHPTEHYRVLLVSESENHSKYSLHNLTVGSDEWRHVTVTMPAASSPSVERKLLMGLRNLSQCPPPVQHRGSLHWSPHGASHITEGGGDIIVFDTEAESFRWMRSPAQLCYKRKLFNMRGTLAFWGSSTPGFTDINVWVMQDYEAEIWAFKFRIDLSMVKASWKLYLTSLKKKKKKKKRKKTPLDSTVELFNDMAMLNERELLIKFNKKHVLRCDIDGKFLGIANLGKSQYQMSLTQHRLQESIVPIPYHEMQEEDEESPFFIEHF